MARVFISHASADIALAYEVYSWLVDAGHEVFLDQDLRDGIAVGEQWKRQLHKRLRWANAMVCVVTSAYLTSQWCAAEVSIALSRGNRLLPIRAEPGVTHALLTSIQHTDLASDQVVARVALTEALRRVDIAGDPEWPADRSPFPGLRPFDTDRHRVFFGRTREIDQLAELLRSMAEHVESAALLVVGPSGCGKSSLVRAGLIPTMTGEPGWWTLPPMVPGADPLAALARGLVASAEQIGLDWTVDHVHHHLAERRLSRLAEELLLAAPGSPQRLLVVVDQLEELLTQAKPNDRERFAELLRSVLGSSVQMVATLRSEALDRLLADPALSSLQRQVYALAPLHHEELRTVIEKPARFAGIEVDEILVATLIEDTDSGEALPLLAFTLAQLADGVGRGGRLSSARYEQLGGVRGALTGEADAALAKAAAIGGRSREQVIVGLLQLVGVDEQGRPTRWRVNRDELLAPVAAELDAFVARRLLTTDIENDQVVIGAAHEAFLSVWPPLAEAIAANASALRVRRAVEQAAVDWADNGHPHDRLWGGGQLAAAVADTGALIRSVRATQDVQRPSPWLPRWHRLLVTDRVILSTKAAEFLRTSIRYDRYRRRRTVTVLSILLVLALAAGAVAFFQQRVTERQRDDALSRQVGSQALELDATNPALAAQLGLAAYQLAPTAEARGGLLSTFANPYATRLTSHTNSLNGLALSPEGHTLATTSADWTARLWDVQDPHRPRSLSTLTNHSNDVLSVAFSSDGHTLATASADQTVRLWDVRDPRQPQPLGTLTGHSDAVYSVAFNPDGRTLATASADQTVRLWDVRDPRQPQPLGTLTGHSDAVYSVAFNPDGRTLVTASQDSTARLWDVRDPRQPQSLSTLTGHTLGVYSVAFSPDGRTLVTASQDSTARLWDVQDPRQPQSLNTLTRHTNAVFSVAFSRDGRTLATTSADSTARLWDVQDPRQPQPLGTFTGHTNVVYSVAFSRDGRTLATASYDRTARLWDLPGPLLASHTNSISSVAFGSDGRILATASVDRTARLWDVQDPRHPQPLSTLTDHTDRVDSVAFRPDGRMLATANEDGTTRLWDVQDPRHPQPLSTLTGHTNAVNAVVFSPDGHTLATTSDDGTARLWDVRDPRQPRPLGVLTGHDERVYSVAFTPDGHMLATASFGGTALLWDVRDPSQPQSLSILTSHTDAVTFVAFGPDGHTLATASQDGTARLWDVRDPRQPQSLSTLTGHTNAVTSVAFSPDGRILATASVDRDARLWDIQDSRQPQSLSTLTGHTNGVTSVAFSPDGHTLATGGVDSTARLWETNVSNVAAQVCEVTWPAITESEWGQYLPGLAYRPPCR